MSQKQTQSLLKDIPAWALEWGLNDSCLGRMEGIAQSMGVGYSKENHIPLSLQSTPQHTHTREFSCFEAIILKKVAKEPGWDDRVVHDLYWQSYHG